MTVIVPVHGRSVLTRNCLDTLLAQELPARTRLLVVDDASPDDTAAVLAGYGKRIEVLTLERNQGFGAACNAGVAAADTELVALLNNDTSPRPGWLAALLRCAGQHPRAAAVGARLLHLDGTVQHAGVVIGQDRLPHHVYAGFPGNHPAVQRSRRLQIVTGACLLLRRKVFLQMGGFDPGYRNGHEDVDLCLRLGAAGHEVHYCGEAVLTNLESASRGRRTTDEQANSRRWCARWQREVVPDDLQVYADDELLRLRYDGDDTPLTAELSPLLATLAAGGPAGELEQLLRQRTSQVHELLQDAVALTMLVADRGDRRHLTGRAPVAPPEAVGALALTDLLLPTHALLRERDDRVQLALAELQLALADRGDDAFTPHPGPAYRALVQRVRSAVRQCVPSPATVLVVSRGDADLLQLGEHGSRHFPSDELGRWAGFHPADSAAALCLLREQQASGATHRVFPSTALWWLDHYPAFADQLDGHLVLDAADCQIYALTATPLDRDPAMTGTAR